MANTISELIKQLQDIQNEHGDLPICRSTVGTILNGVQPAVKHLVKWNEGVRRKTGYFENSPYWINNGTKDKKVLAI